MTETEAERHYGVEIESGKQFRALQRLESKYGERVADWAQEGMPFEAMGTPSLMEQFRDRKGTPVPWNVEERNEQSVQRSAEAAADTSLAGGAGVPETVREVLSSPGQSLDVSIQRTMGERMGDSFGNVRIHAGPQAARACEQIDARAFTVGNHVAFNAGEYDPSSPEGQHVLAHELAHVRQQTQGAVSMLPATDADIEVDPDVALERDAKRGVESPESTASSVSVQRMPKWEVPADCDARTAVEHRLAAETKLEVEESVAFSGFGDEEFETLYDMFLDGKADGDDIVAMERLLRGEPGDVDRRADFVDTDVVGADLLHLLERNVELSETVLVVANGPSHPRWMQEGTPGAGWRHVEARHVEGKRGLKDGLTDFFPADSTIEPEGGPDRTTPPNMDTTDIWKVIYLGLQADDGSQNELSHDLPDRLAEQYGVSTVEIHLYNRGEVKTAFPASGADVLTWNGDAEQWW